MTTYAYDGYGRVTSQSKLDTTGMLDTSGHAGHAGLERRRGPGVTGLSAATRTER